MSLKLYHWNQCESIKHYGYGNVIVIAMSLEEARQKARQAITDYKKENNSWIFDPDEHDDSFKSFNEELDRDIAKTPLITETVVIRGSD